MAIRRCKGGWQADVSLPGRKRKKKNFPTKKEAEHWEDYVKSQARLGYYPFDRPIRFLDFSKIYLERKTPGRSPRAIETDQYRMKNLVDFFGNHYLSKITPNTIEEYKTSRLNKVSPSTINRELALLSNFFHRAVSWGYLPRSPFRDIKKYPEPLKRGRVLIEDELERLLKCSSPSLSLIILIGYYAGLRRGEILDLKWSDFDLKAGFMTVRSTKTGESRSVPLHPILIEEVKRYPVHLKIDFIIPNLRTGNRLKNFKTAWRTATRKAGIENFRFHDLRHTFISNMAMSGADPLTIKRFTGHKTLSMLVRYSHLSDKHMREAINGMKAGETIFSASQMRPKAINGEK
jgi:integrase